MRDKYEECVTFRRARLSVYMERTKKVFNFTKIKHLGKSNYENS